jgi:hypothetical protein
MLRTTFVAVLAAVLALASASAAQVPPCIPLEQAVEFQKERGEEAEMGGRLHTGQVLLVFKTALGDRWTVYLVTPDQRAACFFFSGNRWGPIRMSTVEEER